jgi:hypothetical protein
MNKLILTPLFFLITALIIAQPGSWKQLGKNGEWKATIVATSNGNSMYTVESSGALYKTDLTTGTWKQIGKSEFGNTKFIQYANGSLYTIETNGSLYKVNPSSGSWSQIGKAGEWKATIHNCILGGAMYSIESSGALYKTNLTTGTWKQIGKSEFGNTKFMLASEGSLYTIETNGSLYKINASTGTWVQIGKAGDWKATTAISVKGGNMFSTESSGALYRTSLSSGTWKQLGKPEFGSTKFMVSGTAQIHTIESSGSLYKVQVN